MLVALALACFPGYAAADSSGVQYEDAPPSPTNRGSEIPSRSGGSGGDDSSSSNVSDSSDASGGNPADDGKSSQAGESPRNDRGKDGKRDGQRNRESAPIGEAEELGSAPLAGSGGDDGGSSALVPILIAIAVLAAISIAVVTVRQRRQRRGGHDARVSPEAG